MPMTMQDEDGRDWTAVGFNPATGDLLWVPSDTEIVSFSLTESDEDPEPDEPTDDQLANRYGMEGGIPYSTAGDTRDEHDPSL